MERFKAGSTIFCLKWSWSEKIQDEDEDDDDDNENSDEERSTGSMCISLFNKCYGPLWSMSRRWNKANDKGACIACGPMTTSDLLSNTATPFNGDPPMVRSGNGLKRITLPMT